MDFLFGFDKPVLNEEGLSLLATLYDDVLTEIYESQLQEAGIPYLKKDRGPGTAMRVIMGNNRFGTDIYVQDERFEEAKELLAERPVEDTEDTEEPRNSEG